MSTLPPDSPILRLNTDILHCIINMNADMFSDETALTTTLSTSRVCHTWRTFMLEIPSLWACLIYLDHLHSSTGTWCRELIRRSGTSLLRIKTHRCAIHGYVDLAGCRKFVIDFIGENLGRIQKLEAKFDVEFVHPAHWKPLYLPAPHLESLNLICPIPTSNLKSPFLSLFGGIAPTLREFRATGVGTDVAAPWLHQLHSIELNARLKISLTLEALMLASTLVNLRLDRHKMNDMPPPLALPFVALPRLANLVLHIHDDFNAGVVLLDHIQIPATCSIEFEAYFVRQAEIASVTALGPAVRTISTCARRYFAEHTPTNIWLECSNTYFAIEDQTHPDNRKFKFSIRLDYANIFPPHAFPILLSEFTMPEFAKVTQVKFGLPSTSAVYLPVSEFIAFMACLPSIHTLDVDPFALRYLTRFQDVVRTVDVGPKVVIPFPKLKALKVHPLPFGLPRDAAVPISEFILDRSTHGFPIDTLDISHSTLDGLLAMNFFT